MSGVLGFLLIIVDWGRFGGRFVMVICLCFLCLWLVVSCDRRVSDVPAIADQDVSVVDVTKRLSGMPGVSVGYDDKGRIQSFSGGFNFGDQDLELLLSVAGGSLKVLHLLESRLSKESIDKIGVLHPLEDLRLMGMGLVDDDCAGLGELRNLRYLALTGNLIEGRFLERVFIGNAELKEVDLVDTMVSDRLKVRLRESYAGVGITD